jgi:hypothetical protein
MEREPTDSLANYEAALIRAIDSGYLTQEEADIALTVFIQYEFGDVIAESNRQQDEQ